MYKGVFGYHRAEKARRAEFGLERAAAAASSHGEGHDQFKRQTNVARMAQDYDCNNFSSLEENSFTLKLKQSSSKRVIAKPIQELIDEEMLIEKESRHHSPSVVAKLMGLDTVAPPLPQQVHKQRKNVETSFQSVSSTGSHGKFIQSMEHSCLHSCNNQEFKDIFEVMETTKFKGHKNQSTRKERQSFKGSETEKKFLRQKFMDVKRLSTNEELHNTKKFDDALEILHSNKDLFLEILHDRHSLFAEHLEDVDLGHLSEITVLKSSKDGRCRNSKTAKSERKCNSYSLKNKEPPSFRKSPPRPIKGYCNSASQYPSTSPYLGKTESLVHPTRIVVLKPSLEKTQKMFEPVPFSRENLRFGSRKPTKSVVSAIKELYEEGRDSTQNIGHLSNKVKGSREIAREIAGQMKHTEGSHSKRAINSELKTCARKERSCTKLNNFMLNNSESYYSCPPHSDERCNDFSPSSSYSTETSVSREARKRMSERWKMTHQCKDGIAARGVNTLGEMLALSDRATSDANVIPLDMRKVSTDYFAGNEVVGYWDSPLINRSKDEWVDEKSSKLLRSKSLPASSTAYEGPKLSYRKQGGGNTCYMLKDVLNMSPDVFSDANVGMWQKPFVGNSGYSSSKPHQSQPIGEDNKLPELEIHVQSEELRSNIHVRILSEEDILHPLQSDTETMYPTETLLFPVCENGSISATTQENVKQLFIQSLPEPDGFSVCNNDSTDKDDLIQHPQLGTCGQVLVLSTKEGEQPSPISVLELRSEEESLSSGCFERISADLQELRMQLRLLKLESAERYDAELDITTERDGEPAGDNQLALPVEEKLEDFTDDDDRDFSYLLDILIESGIHGGNQDGFSAASYSHDHLASPDVYEQLEKKYGAMESWSRAERKLLFDLVSSSLMWMMAPSTNVHPHRPSSKSISAWKDKSLAEGLWQMVDIQRKELNYNLDEMILDPGWLRVEDDTEVTAKDLEQILGDEILDEVILEFITG
ncbi:uncharacterized protein LOC122043238 [Zingiber officinale]|uniref:uncharacterized protein LOC122043238 n=1 Tax=Zingiber officinale TaxID=94328 RepID=UPI001C4B41F5|nr:uncharacterized protein LOC122043238 [Zingiber officinale]